MAPRFPVSLPQSLIFGPEALDGNEAGMVNQLILLELLPGARSTARGLCQVSAQYRLHSSLDWKHLVEGSALGDFVDSTVPSGDPSLRSGTRTSEGLGLLEVRDTYQ